LPYSSSSLLLPGCTEEAATRANPVFAGKLNYGREDYRNIISGNNAEVNRMLDPVIPAYGESVIFTRKIQVNGDEMLKLSLKLESEKAESSWGGRILILALIAICLLLVCWTRK
jgi:hypothetical protein